MNGHQLRDDLRSLSADLTAGMAAFAGIHACLFDEEWLCTHPDVDYGGCALALSGIAAGLEKLCGEAARMRAQPEGLTTFRDYLGALLPFLDASRDCVNALRAYCVSMNELARGSGGVAEARELKDLYGRLGVRMDSAREAFKAARARWGF